MAEFLTNKNGKDYLITDTPENRQKAIAKGMPVYDKLLDYEGKEKWVNQNIAAQAIREKGYRTPEGFLGEQETLKGLREKTPYSPLTTGIESAAGSMSYGLGNLASGAVDYASELMRGRPASLKQSLAARELQSQIASSAYPKSSIAGSIAGGFIGPGVGGVLSAGSKLGAAGKIAQGAGIGALEGALSTAPEYISNPLEKTTKELAEQTAYGTGFGLIGGTAGGAISARADIAQGLKGMKQRGTEGLENLFTKKEKTAGKVSETLSPEDLTAKDLADIAGSETDVPKPTGWKALLPEQVGKYISNLEQWAVRKQGISKTKQQLSDIQKIIKEDKKVFLSEIQDELEKRLFNGKTLDDLSADEIASLEPNLIISVQEQLAKIEKDINQFSSQDYVTTRLRMPSVEASPLQKYVAEMSVGGEGGYGEVVKNYEEALKLGPARRAQAQGLDFERAGEELYPSFQKAEEELSKGVSETMDTLTTEAKEAYRFLGVRPEDVSPGLRNEIASFNDAINTKRTNLEIAQKSPARYKEVKALGQELKDLETRRLTLLNKAKQEISARSQQYIESGKEWFNKISQIKDDLRALQKKRGIEKLSQPEQAMQEGLSYVELGGGPKEYGFSNKNYTDPTLDDAERFSRLWKMRQILDDNINWVKYEKGGNLGDDERFLIKARGAIKDELRKYSTAFENSDRIYSMFSDIKEKVFGKGKKPVDRFTLGRMLTDTDTAKRYGEYIKDLRALAADPLISATRRSEIQNFLDQFDKLKLLAKDKATVAAWEKSFGPTGQGTQKAVADAKRLVSAVGESSTIGKLFGDPNKFMKVDQNFAPKIQFITGKPGIKDLATDELLAVTRTNNNYQKAMFNKESVTDDSLKAFYEAELSKIRSKPTPPEGPKGGNEFPPSSGGQSGASFQKKTADRIKEGIRNYALNRLTTAAANQAAKAAGSEQGINVFEPYKDDLKAYLVSEYGISERLADLAVGVLPNNPLDLMNTVKRMPRTQWRPNTVGRTWSISKLPDTEPTLKRPVRFKNENYEHRIYKNDNDFRHVLVNTKTGKPEASLRGSIGVYEGDNDPYAFGLIVSGSSNIGQKGLGQKLYELALETHGKVISDVSLSPGGSAKVYQEKLPAVKGVQVSPARKNSEERFVVYSDKDNEIVKNAKSKKWTKEEKEKLDVPEFQEEGVSGYDEKKKENYYDKQEIKDDIINNKINDAFEDLNDNEIVILANQNSNDKDWKNIANEKFANIPIDYWPSIRHEAQNVQRNQLLLNSRQNTERSADIQMFLARQKIDTKLGKTTINPDKDLIKEARFLNPKNEFPIDSQKINEQDIRSYIAFGAGERTRQENDIITLLNSKNDEIIKAFEDFMKNDNRWWVRNTIKRAARENKVAPDLAKKLIAL